ncbi:MAG: hypothetical protein NUW00_00835 [Candidatus Kaiserbacteria bacterium]|nr:hypothetical protein [Candidatus Kaiserbacteria bacterium]
MELRRLHEKDSNTKAQYALIVATLVTGVIGLVWVSTLPARFENTVSLDGSVEEIERMKESDFGSLIQDTKAQLGNIIGSVPLEENSLDEDSALGSLGKDEILYDEYRSSADVGVGWGSDAEGAVVSSSATSTVTQETPKTKALEPRIILIGTSTDKKTE